MGNTCCTLNNQYVQQFSFQKEVDFQQIQLFTNEQIIEKWKEKDLIDKNQYQNNNNMKLYKFTNNNVYFYCHLLDNLDIQGKCILYKPNKIFYHGFLKGGLPSGISYVQLIDKQCQYEGQVSGWQAHGNGILNDQKNKFSISGNWIHSKPTEVKITFFEDSNIDTIDINNYQRKKAIITYKDNRIYTGQIEMSKLVPHGFGVVLLPSSSAKIYYEGWWYMGEMSGFGQYLYRNGSMYKGEIIDGKKQGFGKFLFVNKMYYEGYWQNGKQNGLGCLYQHFNEQNQSVVYGIWKNGQLLKQMQKYQWKREIDNDYKSYEAIGRNDCKERKQLNDTNTHLSDFAQPVENTWQIYWESL